MLPCIFDGVSGAAALSVIRGDYHAGMVHHPFVSSLKTAWVIPLAGSHPIIGMGQDKCVKLLPTDVPSPLKAHIELHISV